MSSEALQEGYWYAFRKSYSISSIFKRHIPTSFPMVKRFIDAFPVTVAQSYLFREGAYNGYHPMMG
jgi:hypothetical protein